MPDETSTVVLARHLETAYDLEAVNREGVWQFDASLVKNAAINYQQFREQHLTNRAFDIHWHSPVLRTRQSAKIAIPNANWAEWPTLAPRQPKVHDHLFLGYDTDISLPERVKYMFTEFPSLLEIEMDQICSAVLSALECIKPGGSALLFSHMPLVDLALRFFGPNLLKSTELEQGEAYEFKFNRNNACVSVAHLATPS